MYYGQYCDNCDVEKGRKTFIEDHNGYHLCRSCYKEWYPKVKINQCTVDRFIQEVKTTMNWIPLENLSERKPNEINCCDYMHMGAVGDINLYKSIATRRYINIDTDGGYWRYHNGEYYQIDEGTALRRVN